MTLTSDFVDAESSCTNWICENLYCEFKFVTIEAATLV